MTLEEKLAQMQSASMEQARAEVTRSLIPIAKRWKKYLKITKQKPCVRRRLGSRQRRPMPDYL